MSVSTRTVSRSSLKWRAGRTNDNVLQCVYVKETNTHTHTHTHFLYPFIMTWHFYLFQKVTVTQNTLETFLQNLFFFLCPTRFTSVRPPPPTLPVLHYKSSWHNWTATKKPTKNKNKKATTSPGKFFISYSSPANTVNRSLMQQQNKTSTVKFV